MQLKPMNTTVPHPDIPSCNQCRKLNFITEPIKHHLSASNVHKLDWTKKLTCIHSQMSSDHIHPSRIKLLRDNQMPQLLSWRALIVILRKVGTNFGHSARASLFTFYVSWIRFSSINVINSTIMYFITEISAAQIAFSFRFSIRQVVISGYWIMQSLSSFTALAIVYYWRY